MVDKSEVIEKVNDRIEDRISDGIVSKMRDKGVTPVVATVLLMGIAVASTGSYFAFQQTVLTDTQERFDRFNDFDVSGNIRIERCYQDSGDTQIVLRNEADEPMNFSYVNTYLNRRPLTVETDAGLIEARESFEINTTENLTYERDQIKFVNSDSMTTHICQDNEIDRIGSSPGPVAAFTYSPIDPQSGETINFDAGDSTGGVIQYSWDWDNDGNYEENGENSFNSFTAGDHEVTLQVLGEEGKADTQTQTITVTASTGPSVSLNLHHGASTTDTTVKADISASAGSAPISSCTINWGDGNTESTGTTGEIGHTYGSDGTYTAEYTCSDSNGLSDTTTDTLTVSTPGSCTSNTAPSSGFTHSVNGCQVDTNSGGSDPDGSITQYEWDWDNDGNYEGSGAYTTHTYSSDGTYTITHRTTDDCGASTTSTRNVELDSCSGGSDPGTGGGGTGDPTPLKEKGGSGNAEIGLLTIPGTAHIRGEVTNPTTGDTELCIGSNCPDQTGSSTSLDPDIYVNESGDKMTGTLFTDGFKPNTDICIGSNCDSPNNPSGLALSDSNTDTTSNFKLIVPDIKPSSGGSVCLGKNC